MLNYTMCKDNKKSTDNIQQTTDFLIENGKLKMESLSMPEIGFPKKERKRI